MPPGTTRRAAGGSRPAAGPLRAGVLSAAMGPLFEPKLPASPASRLFRPRLPLGPLGSRLRTRGQAGGRDRHRRLGDPVRSRDPAPGQAAVGLPAHRPLGRAAQQPARQGLRAAPVPAPARRPAAVRGAVYWRPRAAGARLRQAAAADAAARAPRPPPHARADLRPGAAREGHARLPARLQADPALEPTGTRRSARPTSSWSPRRSARSVDAPIVGADGSEREVDAIIFGTGFHVTDMPAARRLRGRDGRTLHEVWGEPAGPPRQHGGRASPTSSCCSGPTPASATARWST